MAAKASAAPPASTRPRAPRSSRSSNSARWRGRSAGADPCPTSPARRILRAQTQTEGPMRRRIIPDVVHEQNILSLGLEATVAHACSAMKRRHVGSLLVMDQGRLCGIFPERDVVNRVVAEGLDPHKTMLSIVMTRNPDTIAPNSSPMDALRMMHDRGYRHLPVIAGERVVGIVSRRDFLGDEKTQLEEETRYWQRI